MHRNEFIHEFIFTTTLSLSQTQKYTPLPRRARTHSRCQSIINRAAQTPPRSRTRRATLRSMARSRQPPSESSACSAVVRPGLEGQRVRRLRTSPAAPLAERAMAAGLSGHGRGCGLVGRRIAVRVGWGRPDPPTAGPPRCHRVTRPRHTEERRVLKPMRYAQAGCW